MTARNAASQSSAIRQNHDARIMDEVYRQMFRLEAHRTGSELDLAMVLLRAWIAIDAEPEVSESRQWLRKICPVCLRMIEAEQHAIDTDPPRIQQEAML
ncbi:MAG: hypothetical protein P4K80_02365 [Acidobacteriaceae bacterium]|nr:hypothetical protein [Acidobacteriaceae bacterium]